MKNMSFKPFLRGFCADRRGNVLILSAVFLVVAGCLSAISVDYARFIDTRNRLRAATDSAALKFTEKFTGMQGTPIPEQDKKRLESFIKSNFHVRDGEKFGHVDIQNFTTEKGERRLRLRATASIKPYFGFFFNFVDKKTDGSRAVRVSWDTVSAPPSAESPPVEVVLVLDNTGSMGPRFGNGRKMSDLKAASQDLLNIMIPKEARDHGVKIGLVPFNYFVKLPANGSAKIPASWLRHDGPAETREKYKDNQKTNCLLPRDFPYSQRVSTPNSGVKESLFPHLSSIVNDDRPLPWWDRFGFYPEICTRLAPMRGLTDNRDKLLKSFKKMQPDGGTDIALGAFWAFEMLQPGVPFPGAASFGGETIKVMILMTDGQNTGNFTNTFADRTAADKGQRAICQQAKDKGIKVYSIVFQVNKDAAKNLMKACSSGEGYYFDAKNGKALREAFKFIGANIQQERLRLIQ